MTETIESLDERVKNLESKLGVVVNSLEIILLQFKEAERVRDESYSEMQYTSENLSELSNNVAYLEDVGDGEVY